MLWKKRCRTCSRPRKFSLLLVILVLVLLACSGGLSLPWQATPTPPALVVNLEVTVIQATATATPTVTPSPTTPPTLTLTPTPLLEMTVSPTQEPLPPTPIFTPIGAPPGSNPVSAPLTKTTAITPGLDWQASGISLLEPADGLVLPPEIGPAEFKWMWGKSCEPLPEGQGFEVRIWPERPGAGPMGAMDAAANQADVACEPKSGTRSYRVGQLRDAPGISAGGSGRFRWDVALVQLEPYTVLAVSGSRVFDLGPDPNLPPATPTLLPQVPLTGELQMAGTISLVEPQPNLTLPATQKVEFKWQWSSGGNCLQPPTGYGFELRVWPNRPDYGPMGAMGDARQSQKDIFCDTANGLRGYLVPDLLLAPGVKVAGAGEFRWDVAFVKLDPYTQIATSGSRTFIIPGISKLD